MADRLAAARDDVTFVGTPEGLEARLVPAAGVRFVGLKASGFDRARPWTLVTSSLRIAVSAVRAWAMMRQQRPDVVIGFGGYVSIPVGLAAVVHRIPLVLHEQNSVPGMANKVLSRWARAVGVTYEESAALLAHPDRATVTGNPVRPAVLAASRAAGRASLELPADATVLLVFGGSRGARHLNTALVGLRERLLRIEGLQVVQVAGQKEAAAVRDALALTGEDAARWHVYEYLDQMGDALAAADLVVARAGATSLAEITALGLPSVLVPYPYATDDHQTKNAAAMVRHEAALLVADEELDSQRFGDELVGLLADPVRRATMSAASRGLGRPDSAERVVALAAEVAGVRGESTSTDEKDQRAR